jgi:hypothetical protein
LTSESSRRQTPAFGALNERSDNFHNNKNHVRSVSGLFAALGVVGNSVLNRIRSQGVTDEARSGRGCPCFLHLAYGKLFLI